MRLWRIGMSAFLPVSALPLKELLFLPVIVLALLVLMTR